MDIPVTDIREETVKVKEKNHEEKKETKKKEMVETEENNVQRIKGRSINKNTKTG